MTAEAMEISDLGVGCAADVLERMCFADIGEPGDGQNSGPYEVVVEVAFEGSIAGRFYLAACRDAVQAMAAGFLGQDSPPTTEAGAADVVNEIANMVCGATLSQSSEENQFRLLSPRQVAPSALDAIPSELRRTLWLDEGHVATAVLLGEGPP